ncbi:MAG TPA: hypothetical protein DIC60_06030 [Lachnospiraceae bacterium]|nr:hypothetical protein [Lachnospiraceae bacterium]
MDDIKPKVDPAREFREISGDFGHPLEIAREAISNSFDAKATTINIEFKVVIECGERVLKIVLMDNGEGMDRNQLQAFFDLGNSTRRSDPTAIGEKGHGTKIYFNSRKIEVYTHKNGKSFRAVMDNPLQKLYNDELPIAEIYESDVDPSLRGTEIIITGYNGNRRDRFTHHQLKDYIMWFTKFGCIEMEFGIYEHTDKVLYLKGVDSEVEEELKFGHVFAEENKNTAKLFNDYFIEAPDNYVRKWREEKSLKNFPDIKYQAIFYVAGKKAKYKFNDMIRRQGYNAPQGAYTIQERYGLYICKDFIPIQKKNEWISTSGRSNYTKFHAFINCQDLNLTANRGSVENTPSEILEDLRQAAEELYKKIIESDDWTDLEWLEDQAEGHQTVSKEKKEFKNRCDIAKRSRICNYKDCVLVEPRQEVGVYALFIMLSVLEKNLFPFEIIDYDSHKGIDLIVKTRDKVSIDQSTLRYVEFKYVLNISFNHSFEYLHSIVCWKIHIGHEAVVEDIQGTKRELRVYPPENEGEYTKYFLDDPRNPHKIEVFVLEQYLNEKLGISFFPKTSSVGKQSKCVRKPKAK